MLPILLATPEQAPSTPATARLSLVLSADDCLDMKKILVIDDDPDTRHTIRQLLIAEQFRPIEAADGRQGVALAQQVCPDLILCDVLMPDVDGYTVLKILHEDSRTQLIPFILLTGLNDRVNQRLGMEQGANDFITKPFTHAELLAAIRSQLQRQELLLQHLERERQQSTLLRSAQESLQQTNQILQQALGNFIEEMRNPLTNIKLVLELFEQSPVSDLQRDRYLKILQEELNYQVELLDNLNQLQRLLTPQHILLLNQFGLLKSFNTDLDG